MVIGLAFSLLLSGRDGSPPTTTGEWWLAYLCLGAIGFLNTWDMPFYFSLLVAVYALNLYRRAGHLERLVQSQEADEGIAHPALVPAPTLVERLFARWGRGPAKRRGWLLPVVLRAIEMAVVSVLLYLPYWLYSRPQAGAGILPNLFNVSRFAQLFLMFGTFLVVLGVLLVVLLRDLWREGRLDGRSLLRQGLPVWLATMLAFPLLLALVLLPLVASPTARSYIDDALSSPEVQQFLGPQTLRSLLQISLRIRVGLLPPQLKQMRMPAGPWTFAIISLFIATVVLWFVRTTFPRWFKSQPGEVRPPSPSLQFALLLAFIGLMLVFSVEFVYLRDAFGTRMNTVFKFYFQAWALLGLVAAFGLYYVVEGRKGNRIAQAAFAALFGVLLAAGMLYPLGASQSRTGGFAGPATLDGLAFVARERPDEYAAVQWLNENAGEPGEPPVIVEAVRGSFAYEHARISSRTGLPAVMGWTGHEGQWHGLYDEIGERERDVKLLYGGSVQDAQRILEKYDITYVVVGYLERSEFPDAESKLKRLMDVVFQEGNTTILKRR
jgi:uncharacterized membrane protein